MAEYLCISVTFLDDLFHGKVNDEEPEWPPSPWRLFQAFVAGALTGCRKNGWPDEREEALRWLEKQQPPQIIAPEAIRSTPYTLFVPNNDSDREPERGKRLTSKMVRPHRMINGQTLHYVWRINDEEFQQHVGFLIREARHILALGWGVDQVACDGKILSEKEATQLNGIRWVPYPEVWIPQKLRRVPIKGSLDDLLQCYDTFRNSLRGRLFRPRREPTVFQRVAYLTVTEIPPRPYAYFELRQRDDYKFAVFRQVDAVKVAAMLRYLACEEAKSDPHQFPGSSDRYVAGYTTSKDDASPRFSYLPLPTVGHPQADGMIRRVVIAEPFGGDGRHAKCAARRLHARSLTDDTGSERAILFRVEKEDHVLRCYLGPSRFWSSITPVILPGFDDGKYKKAERLLLKAIEQAGIPIAAVEDAILRKAPFWSGSQHPKHYHRPDYLRNYSAWHVHLRFKGDFCGPIALGPGRHCGLGLLVSER